MPDLPPYVYTRQLTRDRHWRRVGNWPFGRTNAGHCGRIVNIATLALRGSLVKGLASYAGSKGALLGLSQAGAFELAEHGIRVNTVLPSGVMTLGALAAKGPPAEGPARRQPPLGMCDGEDIAAAVMYFASPAARRVTNQVLAVDGGFSIS